MESMNGRMVIYKNYAERLNWFGHELEQGYIQINEYWHAWHAQNVWLQMGFYYGIPAMVFLLILACMTGVRSFTNMLRAVDSEWNLFALMIWIAFFGFGALECVWYPGQIVLFLIFFTQKNCVSNNKKEMC